MIPPLKEASVYLDHVDCPCDDQLFATLELLDDENKPTYFKLSEAHTISFFIIRFLLRLLIIFLFIFSNTFIMTGWNQESRYG